MFIIIECVEGLYGVNCSKMCLIYCLDSKICYYVFGGCDKGCVVGWNGFYCEKGKFSMFCFIWILMIWLNELYICLFIYLF